MQALPFRLARLTGTDQDNTNRTMVDLCCKPPLTPPPATKRRAKLADLDPFMHCSVIGTCMSTTELRKLVPRFADLHRQQATDVEIHHGAVQLANEGGAGCKALQKALDLRYSVVVRQFDQIKTSAQLLARWQEALKIGDVPAAYWALMTHAESDEDIRQTAFGDVHMLSHLVGAANRADIRRLIVLEADNAALRNKIERQQARLHDMSTGRDAAVRRLTAKVASLVARPAVQASDTELAAQVDTLREQLAHREQLLALHTQRREEAQGRAAQEQSKVEAMQRDRDAALELGAALQAEAQAMEEAVLGSPEAGDTAIGLAPLHGKRIVYVGGRPGTHTVLKKMVGEAGGRLIVHDGGIEDRKGMFAAALPRADLVVFPVDCVDHDSMHTLKRACERYNVAYYPLRTASAACFIELMSRTPAEGHAPVSRFCLRHG